MAQVGQLCPLTSPARPLCHPWQGSAADLAKAAMVRIHGRLGRELAPGAARLVLQIHDEFLLEVAGGRHAMSTLIILSIQYVFSTDKLLWYYLSATLQ